MIVTFLKEKKETLHFLLRDVLNYLLIYALGYTRELALQNLNIKVKEL